MYTLINRDRTLCTGVFPTRESAEYWAGMFLPELGLRALELLTDVNTADVVKEHEGWTWGPNSVSHGVPFQLPTC